MPFANISTISLRNLLTGPLAISLNLPDGGIVSARLEAGATFTMPPTVGLDMLNRCQDFHTLIDSGRVAMTLGQGTGDIAGIPASNSALMMSTSANTFDGDGYLLTTTGMCIQSGAVLTDQGPDGNGNMYADVIFEKPMLEATGGPFGTAGPPESLGAYTAYFFVAQGPDPAGAPSYTQGYGDIAETTGFPDGLGMRVYGTSFGGPIMVYWMIVGPLA